MRILIVSWYFPPANDVAALRTGAIAGYLAERGNDVFVVTAARRSTDESLAVPLPANHVIRTRWFDVDTMRLAHTAAPPSGRQTEFGRKRLAGLRRRATSIYSNLIHLPDRQIGWYRPALAAASALVRRESIEVVYASGPPFTTHLVAKAVASKSGIPWVAEYRDGWSGDFYKPRPRWRQRLDQHIETRTVKSAAAIVAVTEPWAEYYRSRYAKPTAAICNGFDEHELPRLPPEAAPDSPVKIAYFGILYSGLRDPSPLYEAIRLSKLSPFELEVNFYGPSESEVRPFTRRFGVDGHVKVRARVSHADSLRIQRQSDVLLLLQAPDDPRNVPAKLYEYIGSERPILGIGLDSGVPARLISERQAGLYSSDPGLIARQLLLWSAEKKKTGTIADSPPAARAGLSRSEQFARLDQFLAAVVADRR